MQRQNVSSTTCYCLQIKAISLFIAVETIPSEQFLFLNCFLQKRKEKKHLQYTSSTGLQFIQCLEFCVKNKLALFLSSFLSVKEEKAVRTVFIPHSSTLEALPISGKIVTSAILGVTYLID